MKLLSKDFSTREVILLLILSVLLVGLLYYYFVHQTVENGKYEISEQKKNLETTLQAVQEKLKNQTEMRQEVRNMQEDESQSDFMPSYNYSKEEMSILNEILADTVSYFVNLSGVTRKGNQIRRKFSLGFTSKDYAGATGIITQLENCGVRCLVGDIECNAAEGDVFSGSVTLTTSVTFYETMFEGQEDNELPADSDILGTAGK